MSKVNYPKLHNATWPGIVGKGGEEPIISLDELLEKTAAAEVNGVKFDGVDLGLFEAHVKLDASDDNVSAIVDKVGGYGLDIGTLVAPIWAPDGGSAMGTADERNRFVDIVKRACELGYKLRKQGIRTSNVIRIDSSTGVEEWAKDPVANTKLIAETFRRACDVAADYGERLATEGEICWGGMHSWKNMLDTLEQVDRENIGFQADMSHSFLYLLGYNCPEHRILKEDFLWDDREELERGLRFLTEKLRPWTIDFHVAQNDGTVFGSGSHDKTGRHCLPTDPNGKLDIVRDAGFWMRNEKGELNKAFNHICWDGCMFPNEVMHRQETWNSILETMIAVREAHGWK
ncbi:TIM barrel protein [Sphingobacterium sp. UT-1RO-CII-1]|uniref:sugar phosphate isomerase/epimerase family protein n=1 Tax=Sphingobacterium sp. UT-1RO-CII-1 TaxID=2995225 RepID=UPI00227D6A1C|nr:TIM barrel protein [Sphingobacterium sp. UT-1RO-CII-1]MCY4778358.1 TIM barrel protein [Sphingobacterium sp. UT-1RO-CII-1]